VHFHRSVFLTSRTGNQESGSTILFVRMSGKQAGKLIGPTGN